MAALGPGLIKVELWPGWPAGGWVDVSSKVNMFTGVQITPAQPPDIFEDVEPGQAVFTLYCDDGVWWPDNPNSPYAGQIVEGMPVRITGTLGSATSTRHQGKVRVLEPSLVGSVAVGAECTFTSTDTLADLAGYTMRDRLSETLRHFARPAVSTYTNGPDAWDSWPLTDEGSSATLASARTGGNDARIVPAKGGLGNLTLNAMDGSGKQGPMTLPAFATFEPVSGIGPIIQCPVTAATAGQVWFAWRTTVLQDATVAAGWDGSANLLWRLRQLVSGDAVLYNGDGSVAATMQTGTAANGVWHTMVCYFAGALPINTSAPGWFSDETGVAMSYNPGALRKITLGGGMNPALPGKQSSGFTGDITMLGVAGFSGLGGVEASCAVQPSSVLSAMSVIAGFAVDYLPNWDLTPAVTAMPVARFPTQDVTALEALRSIARTVGGQLVVQPGTGGPIAQIKLYLPEDPAPDLASAFTVTLTNDDADAKALPMIRGGNTAPTRVTVTSPLASATYVGDESVRRQDDAITSLSVDQANAYAIGSAWVNRPRSSRLSPITIDLATALGGQGLATAVLAMFPMVTTFTLAGLMVELFGRTAMDQIVVGWTETWTWQHTEFALECLPAYDWPLALFDGSAWGHFGAGGALTVTNGASLGTGTGTVSVVSSTGDLMATGTGLYWNWRGEAVFGTASGSSSPQTLTITGRGQLGTTARVHTNGESLDAWLPATFGY